MDYKKSMAVNKQVAELILRAQNASDGGKGIRALVNPASKKTFRDNRHEYSGKDMFVLRAIEMIARNRRNTSFRYFVCHDDDGIAMYLVYFETIINGETLQVSFHSFDERLERFVKKSFGTVWDERSSRGSAVKIYNAYLPNGRYVNEDGTIAYKIVYR